MEADNTSLMRALGPTARVNWVGRYWSGTQGQRRALFIALGVYLVGIALAVLAKVWGFDIVPWGIGLAMDLVVAVVLLLLWAHLLVPTWAFGFVVRQPGGEAGFSPKDGIEGSKEFAKGLGEFFLGCLFYGSLVFYGIGFFRVEDNLFGIIPVLGVSIGLIAYFATTKSTFFRSLVVLIKLAVLLWFIVSWTPGLATLQKDAVAWTEHQMGLKSIKDGDTDPKRQAERAAAETVKNQRAACYQEIEKKARGDSAKKVAPVIPTAADFEKCRAIGAETTTVVSAPPQSTAAEQVNGTAQSPTPAPTVPTATVETAETEVVETAWSCDTIWREFHFTPQWQDGQGGKAPPIMLPAGRFEFVVSGKRLQPFLTGTPAILDKTCEMDPDGRMGICVDPQGRFAGNVMGGTWTAPANRIGSVPTLVPGQAYGKFVLHAWGHPLPVEEGRLVIHTGRALPVALDVNNFQHPANYDGSGSLRVTIKQCTET